MGIKSVNEKIKKIREEESKISEIEKQLNEMRENILKEINEAELLFSDLIKSKEGWNIISLLLKKENKSDHILRKMLDIYFKNDEFLSEKIKFNYISPDFHMCGNALAFLFFNEDNINRKTYQDIIENHMKLKIETEVELCFRGSENEKTLILSGQGIFLHEEDTPVVKEINEEKLTTETLKKYFKFN